MKKSRIFSALLVLALLSTCVIGGTFAKYVTTSSGTDSAKVAKFGVTIAVNDDLGLFKTSYAKDDSSASSANTVVSATTDKKVAPGTKGSMSFTVSGTPEVATKLTAAFTDSSVITLAAGEYTLAAGAFADKECKVTITDAYEPIKWYFGTTAISDSTVYSLSLADLKTAIEGTTAEKAPNVAIDATYYIGWKWDFEPASDFSGTWTYNGGSTAPYTDAKIANFLDTYLGDESTLKTEAFTLAISVTQID